MAEYIFGVDIGGTSIKFGLFLTDGTVLDRWEVNTRLENNGTEIIPDVAKSIQNKMYEKKLKKEEIAGVGVGVPGPVTENGEVIVAVNLHWGHTKVAKDLEKLLNIPVKAGNDANGAGCGQPSLGAQESGGRAGSRSGIYC